MLRIGIAASKMAKSNLLAYNLIVILIACLFSFILFLVSGIFILFVVFIVSLILHGLKSANFHEAWLHMFKICLMVLAVVVGVINIVAIVKNIQFTKKKI